MSQTRHTFNQSTVAKRVFLVCGISMIRETGRNLEINTLNKRIFIQVVNLRKMHKSQGAFHFLEAFLLYRLYLSDIRLFYGISWNVCVYA